MPATPPCRAILTPTDSGEYSVRFELSNPTAQPISLDTYAPFLQFQLRASTKGTALSVAQPTLDVPLNATTVTVPAGGTFLLVTPVRLRFDAVPSSDRFVWSIPHAPDGVELTFSLDLPAPFDQPFTATL